MMTRGGEHSEKDIKQAVVEAQRQHGHIKFVYALAHSKRLKVAGFLAGANKEIRECLIMYNAEL